MSTANSKSTRVLYDSIIPLIDKEIDLKEREFTRYVLAYINKNTNSLQVNGPIRKLVFHDNDKQFLFTNFKINPSVVKDTIKRCDIIQPSWQLLNNPFNVLSGVIIANLVIKKKDKYASLVMTFLMLKFYSSIQYHFAKYGLNPNIMDYAVNHMSNKFKMKQFNTIFDAILDSCNTCHETFKERLMTGSDEAIKNYIMSINTRIRALIKKMINEYEICRKSGAYMNTEEDSSDDENYKETTNDSMVIEKMCNALTLSVLGKPINDRIVRMCARDCDVSYASIKTALTTLINKKNEQIKVVFRSILQVFLSDTKNRPSEVNSKKFIAFSLSLYRKGNIKDESVNKIKEILDDWLSETSATYVKTNREATKNNFRRAVYMYFVLYIYQYNF